jgi:hypothetical protein
MFLTCRIIVVAVENAITESCSVVFFPEPPPDRTESVYGGPKIRRKRSRNFPPEARSKLAATARSRNPDVQRAI